MPVHPELGTIDFRLPLQKVNPRRAPKAARNHELFRGDSTGSSVQSATGIEGNASLPFRLGWVISVQGLSRWSACTSGHPFFHPRKASPHPARPHNRGKSARPGNGNRGISPLGIGQGRLVVGGCPPPWICTRPGKPFAPFGYPYTAAIMAGSLSFENTDPVTQNLEDHSVFLPFLEHLHLQRPGPRIEALHISS